MFATFTSLRSRHGAPRPGFTLMLVIALGFTTMGCDKIKDLVSPPDVMSQARTISLTASPNAIPEGGGPGANPQRALQYREGDLALLTR